MARNKYMQEPGRGNEAMDTPLAMHGSLYEKSKGKRIGIHGSDYIEHDEEKTFDYSQKSKDYEKKFKPKYREDRFGKRASQAAGAVITGLIGKYMQIKKNQR